MRMNTIGLLSLRLFNITFGRLSFCTKILRVILVKILIKNKQEKYVACAKYFDWQDLKRKP
ncbi:MAG: hypothetical protein PHQ96_00045 [Candidatus Omnitrophica bacterium]|nr:hypothetical protein [Candidatus Omnitrophota bacterium]